MARPVYLVTKHHEVQGKQKVDRYTGSGAPSDGTWHVGMVHGFFAGQGLDLYFENEPQADTFSLFELFDPSQIIEAVGPQSTFTVADILRSWASGSPNQFTGQKVKIATWQVKMEGQDANLTMTFPDEGLARRFGVGRSYSMVDILGTLPSIPADVADQIAAFTRAQQAAAEAAQRAQEAKAAAAKAAAEQQAAAEQAAAQAAADQAAADAAAAAQAAQQQQQGLPTQPTHLGTAQWWTITDGGAAGWYNGTRFNTGQFTYAGAILGTNLGTNNNAPAYVTSTWIAPYGPAGGPAGPFTATTTLTARYVNQGAWLGTPYFQSNLPASLLIQNSNGAVTKNQFEWYGSYSAV